MILTPMEEDDEDIEVLEVVNPTKEFVPDKMVSGLGFAGPS